MAFLRTLIIESIGLIDTNSADRNTFNKGQFPIAITTFSSFSVNILSLLTGNTFICSEVKHAVRAVKTGFRKVGKGRLDWTCCQVVLSRFLEQLKFEC